MRVKERLFDYIRPDADYEIKNGDCLTILKKIEDGKFDLILTSPPYNVGKSYETKTSIEKYLETQEEIISELVRTLSNRGNLCWQVGNYVDKGEIFPLDIFYYQIFKKYRLKLRIVLFGILVTDFTPAIVLADAMKLYSGLVKQMIIFLILTM